MELVSNTKYFLGTDYFKNSVGANFLSGDGEVFHAVEVLLDSRRETFGCILPNFFLNHLPHRHF